MNVKIKSFLVILSAILIPSSGHVLLGKPMRGLMLVFWMLAFGFITYHLTGPDISFWGRYSGGLLVWILSVLEVGRMLKKKV